MVNFFKHGFVTYQIDGDDKQNRMQVKFSSWGQTGDLGVRSKSLNFGNHDNFKHFLYQTLCVFSQIEDRKHIEQNFHSVAGVMPQGWDLGVLGSKTLACMGFAIAPHRLRVLVSSVAIILKRKRELVALLLLSCGYLVTVNVLGLFLA